MWPSAVGSICPAFQHTNIYTYGSQSASTLRQYVDDNNSYTMFYSWYVYFWAEKVFCPEQWAQKRTYENDVRQNGEFPSKYNVQMTWMILWSQIIMFDAFFLLRNVFSLPLPNCSLVVITADSRSCPFIDEQTYRSGTLFSRWDWLDFAWFINYCYSNIDI